MKIKLILLALLVIVTVSLYMFPVVDRVDISPTHPAEAWGGPATRDGAK